MVVEANWSRVTGDRSSPARRTRGVRPCESPLLHPLEGHRADAAGDVEPLLSAGIELDARYCDVIIRRLVAAAQIEAIHAETGKPFAEIEQERAAVSTVDA